MFERTIPINGKEASAPNNSEFPQNVIRNQKYSLWTFLPMTLFEQFFTSFINAVMLLQ